MEADAATIRLYRPVDPKELELIAASGFRGFPTRLPEQPIFYPVTNEAYAIEIARDWNTRFGSKEGIVTTFQVARSFIDRFERRIVGGKDHGEYWIPADDLPEFNRNIIGQIEVLARFTEADRLAAKGKSDNA
jgi:hypothetical protein